MTTVLQKVGKVLRRRPKQLDLVDYVKKMSAKGYDKDGNFIPNPVPVAPPIGYKKQPSMVDIIRDMVHSERLAQEAANAGMETLEEADDFDVPDDPLQLRSPFENDADPSIKDLLEIGRQELARRKAAETPPETPADVPVPPRKPAVVPPTDGPAPPTGDEK